MSGPDPLESLDEASISDLCDVAARLRALGERCRSLELVCHDLARILERMAAASLAEIEVSWLCSLTLGHAPLPPADPADRPEQGLGRQGPAPRQ